MSAQDHPEHSPESPLSQLVKAPTSRRTVLRRGVGVGAAGLAVAAGGGGLLASLLSSNSPAKSATLSGVNSANSGSNSHGIVIYIPDPKSGEMEIFRGTGKTTASNRQMTSMVASMAPH